MFGLGLAFFAIGYIGLGMTSDHGLAWVLIGVYGLFTACTDGVGKAWVSELAGSAGRPPPRCVPGRQRLAILIAGIWAGLFWGSDGSFPLLVSGVVGACFAAVLLGRWRVFRSAFGRVCADALDPRHRYRAGDPDYVTTQAIRRSTTPRCSSPWTRARRKAIW